MKTFRDAGAVGCPRGTLMMVYEAGRVEYTIDGVYMCGESAMGMGFLIEVPNVCAAEIVLNREQVEALIDTLTDHLPNLSPTKNPTEYRMIEGD